VALSGDPTGTDPLEIPISTRGPFPSLGHWVATRIKSRRGSRCTCREVPPHHLDAVAARYRPAYYAPRVARPSTAAISLLGAVPMAAAILRTVLTVGFRHAPESDLGRRRPGPGGVGGKRSQGHAAPSNADPPHGPKRDTDSEGPHTIVPKGLPRQVLRLLRSQSLPGSWTGTVERR